MFEVKKGDRVRFLGFKDPYRYAHLTVGIEGTVELILICYPHLPVYVKWENGIEMMHKGDEVEKIERG